MPIQLLLRTPDPIPGEGIFGYVLRLSERNGYDSPWHVFQHAGYLQQEMIAPGFEPRRLAAIVGKEADLLERYCYSRLTDDGQREFQLNGHSLGRRLGKTLRVRRPAICTACIEADGFADACWDAQAFVACPKHGRLLLLNCPACESHLKWFRPGLLQCHCGASLAGVVADTASAATQGLMAVLRSTIRREALPPDQGVHLSLPHRELSAVPLRGLLHVLSVLEKLDTEAKVSDGPDTTAADVFFDWPNGFHAYLRRMASTGIASGVETVGLRKRFHRLYEGLFKRCRMVNGMEFMREEFVRFGRDEWGDGVVDFKLMGSEPTKSRFTSASALASELGVMHITVRRWMEVGAIPFKTVEVGQGSRFVADSAAVSQVAAYKENRVHGREAAKLSGLPVSALRELKKSGHYSTNAIANCRAGFWPVDLQQLNDRLLATAGDASGKADEVECSREALVSLGRILGFWKLGAVRAKGAFLAEVLDGELVPVRRSGDHANDLLFRIGDVESFRVRFALGTGREYISAKTAAHMLGASTTIVAALVEAGHFLPAGDHGVRLSRCSVDKFMESWKPLNALAKELNTSSMALRLSADALDIKVMRVPYSAGRQAPFVATADAVVLRQAFANRRSKRRSGELV
ncbi:TniQ family protein [Roseateles violae]|uniref:TniQ family protein n=1 Tax=Roseateles violae TaxID=3058042 RepID=A0ABT8DWJ6_9BURK|nr:TniQ family protein [Pelomonas sp. PFR6]MDN3922553.1 TniQ family protein [Pelomonas sp. PFR6]